MLVVDDMKEQREIAAKIIEQLGYVAKSVESGEQAVELLRHERADLLILDMIMEPGIDGLETYHRVKKLHPHQKAIITSGYAETARINRPASGSGLLPQEALHRSQHGGRHQVRAEPQLKRSRSGDSHRPIEEQPNVFAVAAGRRAFRTGDGPRREPLSHESRGRSGFICFKASRAHTGEATGRRHRGLWRHAAASKDPAALLAPGTRHPHLHKQGFVPPAAHS